MNCIVCYSLFDYNWLFILILEQIMVPLKSDQDILGQPNHWNWFNKFINYFIRSIIYLVICLPKFNALYCSTAIIALTRPKLNPLLFIRKWWFNLDLNSFTLSPLTIHPVSLFHRHIKLYSISKAKFPDLIKIKRAKKWFWIANRGNNQISHGSNTVSHIIALGNNEVKILGHKQIVDLGYFPLEPWLIWLLPTGG